MRKVIGIGETVLDIIFKDNKPVEAVPGGSAFNAIISLGRCGLNVSFISEAGHDRVGDYIMDFLKDNHVDVSNVSSFQGSKSPISLAFLDDGNEAEYLFYKNHPNDHLDFTFPDIHPDDIVLFGSFYAVNPVIRPQVVGLLDYAKSRGAIIYYDVNFRPAHKDDVLRITPNFLENLDYADIVRGSKEDFETLFKKDDVDKVYNSEISFYCNRFIYTQGANPVGVRGGKDFKKAYPIKGAAPVSTIGAGDNFNAGFIYGMVKYHITKADLERGLSEEQWDKLVECALEFSAESCKDIFNYVSKSFGDSMRLD